jgi:hypothetical protein
LILTERFEKPGEGSSAREIQLFAALRGNESKITAFWDYHISAIKLVI